MSNDEDICIICRIEDTNLSVPLEKKRITKRGADGVNRASKLRGTNIVAFEGSQIHKQCQIRYTDQKDIKKRLSDLDDANNKRKSIRLSNDSVKTDTNDTSLCLFCDQPVNFETNRNDSSKVETDNFVDSISKCVFQRGDEWSYRVKGKIEFFSSDLHAADTVYHRSCSTNFRIGKKIPLRYSNNLIEGQKLGRPENMMQYNAFIDACSFFEGNNDEQFTLIELTDKMNELLVDTEYEAYAPRHIKRKLLEFYGENVIISGGKGAPLVVTHRESANTILKEFNKKPKTVDIDLQKIQIIEAAARLIKSETLEALANDEKTFYPPVEDLSPDKSIEYLPNSLKLLLSKLFKGKNKDKVNVKISAIGQSIVQASRPRAVLCPLQIGFAVQMHHHFQSKYLLDCLHSLGFSSSYKEVLKFERNAAMVCGAELEGFLKHDSFIKFSADNVDHNVCTLDGKNTFHGMGMIVSISNGRFCSTSIPRKIITDRELLEASKVTIFPYQEAKSILRGQKNIVFKQVQPQYTSSIYFDLLWQMSWHFKNPQPIWSGYMQLIHEKQNKDKYEKENIVFLPIIDLDPTNMSCIYSTLLFLSNLSFKNNQPTVIAFDQPLFWKGNRIIAESNIETVRKIVVLLGNFHTIYNLLGCIGYLMADTGLSDILGEVYGESTVIQMLSGKAYSRALRGHLLVDQVLSRLIFETTIKEQNVREEIISKIENIHKDLMSSNISLDSSKENQFITSLHEEIKNTIEIVNEKSRTAALWSEYQRIIHIIKNLITADRTGNWMLHLEAIHSSLPIFAASGHYNYAKSASLYLQNMIDLERSNPEVYSKFKAGRFIVRRSERYWAGLPCDLIIEQVLMRSLKTTGGLTRGSGMSDVTRAIWVMSKPVCSKYGHVMEENIGVVYTTSEQHKTSSKSRIARDRTDIEKIYKKLFESSPFTDDPSLRNIMNGITASESVNVDRFPEIGKQLLMKMSGQNVFTYEFSRKERAKNMSSQVTLCKKNDIKCDPALLFQRLLFVSQSNPMNLDDLMSYELSAYPLSLFETSSLLRKADKPKLADAIVKVVKDEKNETSSINSNEEDSSMCQFVLDGGSLLHRIGWKKNLTYGEIADSYSSFVISRYGKAKVVFDGYNDGPSTKDMTHLRRSQKHSQREIIISRNTKCTVNKDEFLSNEQNKEKLIHMIGSSLETNGCEITYSNEDADVDIAKVAIESSKFMKTVLIGEDTDLLVLLLFYCKENPTHELILRSDKENKKKENISHNIGRYREILGQELCSSILFIHAFSGCDTTSQFFGIGKGTAFELFRKNESTNELFREFTNKQNSKGNVERSGENAALILFNGKQNESEINEVRKRMFSKKVAKATNFVKPEKLPPTKSALKFHSHRVYYQIMKWLQNDTLKAEDWGWVNIEGKFYPKTTDKQPAPESLLKTIGCNCNSDCSTMHCGCRKGGYSCSSVCGNCQITECSNIDKVLDLGQEHHDVIVDG